MGHPSPSLYKPTAKLDAKNNRKRKLFRINFCQRGYWRSFYFMYRLKHRGRLIGCVNSPPNHAIQHPKCGNIFWERVLWCGTCQRQVQLAEKAEAPPRDRSGTNEDIYSVPFPRQSATEIQNFLLLSCVSPT